MNTKLMMLVVGLAIAASPAVWAQSDQSQTPQQTDSGTAAFLAWQAERDATARQRLAGATTSPVAKAAAVQSMWNAPIKTDDAVPTENSADQKTKQK